LLPPLGRDLLQKRKKQKTANPEFQIIKKKKNPPNSSTNQTQFGLHSSYFKEPGSRFQLAENLDLSSKTCSKNQTLFDVELYKKKALKNGNRRQQETQSKDQSPGTLKRVPERGAPRR
jgi:hypothetical protein